MIASLLKVARRRIIIERQVWCRNWCRKLDSGILAARLCCLFVQVSIEIADFKVAFLGRRAQRMWYAQFWSDLTIFILSVSGSCVLFVRWWGAGSCCLLNDLLLSIIDTESYALLSLEFASWLADTDLSWQGLTGPSVDRLILDGGLLQTILVRGLAWTLF